jgi:membrane protease YdiL (CAAX protease family)
MFLENAVTPENKFWKYIVGSVVIIAASFIGQIPFMIAIAFKSFSSGKPFPTDEKALMTFLNPNLSLFLLMLSFAFAFLAIFLVIKYFHKQTFLSVTTSRSKMDWKRFFFSFSIWGIFTIASTVIMYYANPESFEINFKPIPFAILAVIAIVLIPIQTSTEEYIFRGYLMQGFANLAKNKWFPLVMTSVIFGTMHIANPEVQKLGYIIMIYYIGTGLFLGILTLMDEGMELALGFHAANNLIAALLITSDWSAFQTESILKDNSEPSAGFEILVPVFIIFPILLFIFSKKYGWTNWKEKLTGKIEEKNVEPF